MLYLRPHAKINLGLFIKGKREDGYHLLETLMYPVLELQDHLWIEVGGARCEFELDGPALPGDPRDNLCVKAWKALKAVVPELPGVRIRLRKEIPAGAGLGGGSSDAAFVLRGLAELCQVRGGEALLHEVAATLGADVPFFLKDIPQMASGTGTDLNPFSLSFPYLLKVFPQPIHSSTIAAYRRLDYTQFDPQRSLEQVLSQSVEHWKDKLHNDLEVPVFDMYPQLRQRKQQLYQEGALYASMSGSGSAMFALFAKEEESQ
ncbi:MAG: 4-(cytidine 5'-diphospho)-2-C-methyl-D-erythritol kinase [Bacteroidota bacterium]